MLTVITVCFNSEKTIEKCIQSVLEQKYNDIEYIIIDGKSTDKTVEILKKYEEKFLLKNRSYKYISEKDSGIYDAMNKGLKLAAGKWIYFLGSDDYLYDNTVFEKIFLNDSYFDYDVIVGKVKTFPDEIDINQLKKINKFKLWLRPSVCHQSIIAKKETLSEGFSLYYRIASDLHWFFEVLDKKYKIINIKDIIAFYSLNGESSINKKVYEEIIDIFSKKIGKTASSIRKGVWKLRRVI